MRIFLVAGKSGSGKGEVAKFIKEYYIYKLKKCAITSYSKVVRELIKELTDWNGESGSLPRDFAQELSDTIRNVDSTFLSKDLLKRIPVYEKYLDVLIVSDVRMPNEIDDIKNCYDDVYSIYVVNQFGMSTLTVEQQAHITENALEGYLDFDYTMANDNINALRDKVFNYLEGLDK